MSEPSPGLRDLRYCFEGAVPAVIATASVDGTPNVTYLSKVRLVDDERVALSNQFFSKTTRNLAENPRASVLVIDPTTYDEFRLDLVYERTDRRGPVFERLREDVDLVAAIEGMQDVFRLRTADVYRVVHVEQVPAAVDEGATRSAPPASRRDEALDSGRLGVLTARLGRCADLDTLLDAALAGLEELFGYDHTLVLLLDGSGERLYTIASRGYEGEGLGSEVPIGEGILGLAAQRAAVIDVGNAVQIGKYSKAVRRRFEDHGEIGPGRQLPVPGLPDAQSCVAVPAMALGQVVGVVAVESARTVAFTAADEAVLGVVASVVATAIEIERERERAEPPLAPFVARGSGEPDRPPTHVRFFAVDGSTFVDGEYLIKGVAGRILWSLLGHHATEGRTDFTNREVRLDPSLQLPELRDNFESRLILLKRRLDERDGTIRLEKTGRGRFRLVVDAPLQLDAVDPTVG